MFDKRSWHTRRAQSHTGHTEGICAWYASALRIFLRVRSAL